MFSFYLFLLRNVDKCSTELQLAIQMRTYQCKTGEPTSLTPGMDSYLVCFKKEKKSQLNIL